MVIAVTGSKGFIGSHMVTHLTNLGHTVICVDGDIKTCELPVVDGFMHFAANMGGVGFFSTHQFDPIVDNLLMDARVVDHCRKHNIKLLYPSSACAYPVYAMNDGKQLSEEMLNIPADPDQMYGLEKYLFTKLSDHADFMRVVVLHTIYGEGQEFEGHKAKFPPQICHKFVKDEEVEVWGHGYQTRTFLHIDDAVEMMSEVFFSPEYHGAVNISHPHEIAVKEVVKYLSDHTGKKVYFNADKPTGPLRRAVNMRKFYKHYSSRPSISVKEGIIRLYEHIKATCA